MSGFSFGCGGDAELQMLRSRVNEQQIQLDAIRSENVRVAAQLTAQTKVLEELDAVRFAQSVVGERWSQSKEDPPIRQLIDKANRVMEIRAESFLKNLFDKHAETSYVDGKCLKLVSKAGLQATLLELNGPVSCDHTEDCVEDLMKMHDIDEYGGLDLEGFQRAARQIPSPLEQWVETLSLPAQLAACLPTIDSDGDPLRQLIKLDKSSIELAVQAFSGCLLGVLLKGQASLKERFRLQDAKALQAPTGAAAKYTVFEMNAGTITDTQTSLADRIGTYRAPRPAPRPEKKLLLSVFKTSFHHNALG
jgi:hypothetical protein